MEKESRATPRRIGSPHHPCHGSATRAGQRFVGIRSSIEAKAASNTMARSTPSRSAVGRPTMHASISHLFSAPALHRPHRVLQPRVRTPREATHKTNRPCVDPADRLTLRSTAAWSTSPCPKLRQKERPRTPLTLRSRCRRARRTCRRAEHALLRGSCARAHAMVAWPRAWAASAPQPPRSTAAQTRRPLSALPAARAAPRQQPWWPGARREARGPRGRRRRGRRRRLPVAKPRERGGGQRQGVPGVPRERCESGRRADA